MISPKTLAINPTNKLALVKRTTKPTVVKKHINGRFLKGPIMLNWLIRASILPCKTLEVGIVLWYYSGVKKSRRFGLPNKILKEFGVNRYAKARALKQLLKAGLISMEQGTGKSPVITLLDINDDVKP